MTDAEKDVRLFSVSEMASMFGLSRQTLIYYDRVGLFSPSTVAPNGYRKYSVAQFPVLREICLLRELDVPIEKIVDLELNRSRAAMRDTLRERRDEVDVQIDRLNRLRHDIALRLDFYTDVAEAVHRIDEPFAKDYPERWVVFHPFPKNAQVDRHVLHTTTAQCMQALRQSGLVPSEGFGTRLRCEDVLAGDPTANGGIFVPIPAGSPIDVTGTKAKVVILPKGRYACISRWGMPYEPAWADALFSWAADQGFELAGHVYDFNMLDATSYDNDHDVDLCTIQIKVRAEEPRPR